VNDTHTIGAKIKKTKNSTTSIILAKLDLFIYKCSGVKVPKILQNEPTSRLVSEFRV